MDTQPMNQEARRAPLYPVRPLTLSEAHGELLYAYGRMFARDRDGRWAVVDAFDGDTDD